MMPCLLLSLRFARGAADTPLRYTPFSLLDFRLRFSVRCHAAASDADAICHYAVAFSIRFFADATRY